MTILSFKSKGRGGGCGARERHIVFKLKAQLLFPRQVCLPPPRARGRQPSDGIVIHQGPVTAAEGLTPPTARLASPRLCPHPAKVTPPLQPQAPQHPPLRCLVSSLLSPSVLIHSCPHHTGFPLHHSSSVPGKGTHKSSSPQRQAGDVDVIFWGRGGVKNNKGQASLW